MLVLELRILITPLVSSSSSRGHSYNGHGIGGVMASLLAVSVVDGRPKTGRVKLRTLLLAFVASLLSTVH